jgi:hypothetical protein
MNYIQVCDSLRTIGGRLHPHHDGRHRDHCPLLARAVLAVRVDDRYAFSHMAMTHSRSLKIVGLILKITVL